MGLGGGKGGRRAGYSGGGAAQAATKGGPHEVGGAGGRGRVGGEAEEQVLVRLGAENPVFVMDWNGNRVKK